MKPSAIVLTCLGLLASLSSVADEASLCAPLTGKSKTKVIFSEQVLITSLLGLQGRGEASFHPVFGDDAETCLEKSLDLAGTPVAVRRYSPESTPGETGMVPLVRFSAGTVQRDIVLYSDPLTSLVAEFDVSFLVEDREGSISYYAIYRGRPSSHEVQDMVQAILDGSAKPLATVRWPTGAPEPLIDAIDSKRLK